MIQTIKTKQELAEYILRFAPNLDCMGASPYQGKYKKAIRLATVLAACGIERIEMNVRFDNYNIENVIFTENSIMTFPYISLPKNEKESWMPRPILWEILDAFNLRHGGGASQENDYAQASWLEKNTGVNCVDLHSVFGAIRRRVVRDFTGEVDLKKLKKILDKINSKNVIRKDN